MAAKGITAKGHELMVFFHTNKAGDRVTEATFFDWFSTLTPEKDSGLIGSLDYRTKRVSDIRGFPVDHVMKTDPVEMVQAAGEMLVEWILDAPNRKAKADAVEANLKRLTQEQIGDAVKKSYR